MFYYQGTSYESSLSLIFKGYLYIFAESMYNFNTIYKYTNICQHKTFSLSPEGGASVLLQVLDLKQDMKPQ